MGRTRKQLSVIKVREILRLKEQGLSNRQIASSCRISSSTVWDYATAAKKRGIRLQDYADRSDSELLVALGKPRADEDRRKTEPDCKSFFDDDEETGAGPG
jgi:predicted transcriptional regulator